ncbi:SLIT and NTRK-like protein 6 [Bufo bufo]|uniref:SLIT and NTRK-like protein 6 n=1 Tax=Bufo bufo TaxID=8384 RepID=UPI001ABE0AFE|nr:SLIT and NTRK-like protein 6 [Bufo bufo]XP_040281253.1 SLIT and NTRK-like protein 6 [Bufo bufo]
MLVLNTMSISVFFLIYCLLIASSVNSASESLLLGSCKDVCLCEEKDGSLLMNCEEKDITTLSEIEAPPSQYLEINLLNNGLYKLHINEFSDFNHLISLHLGFNNIVEIEPGAFNDLHMLKKLHINHNSLEILRENTFSGLENLEFLQADNNFITTIEANTFSKVNRLKVLILNDNAIHFLPPNIFRFVPLTHLDLRGNQLQNLPYVGLLEHIGRIIELQLDDNRWVCNCDLLQLKIWLENMPRQSTIGDVVCFNPPDLKGSILRKLKKEMFCITTPSSDLDEPSVPLSLLGTASINDGRLPTKITSLPKNPTKETFVLTKAATIPPGIYCPIPCHCSSYSVSGNLIHCQEQNIESISDLESLPLNPRKLILAGNIIHRIYKSDFTEYGTLEMLHLGNNLIELIQEQSFQNLTKLQKLYLNGNHLRSLNSGIFIGLLSIEYLYLEYNAISEISSGTFSVMPKLKVLYLNNNLLKTLPEYIFSGVPLSKLNLKSNQFVNIPLRTVLEELALLTQIDLQENPWDCTCNLTGLQKWIQIYKMAIISDVFCHSPKKLANMDLKTLDKEDLCPELKNDQALPTQLSLNSLIPTSTSASNVDSILKSLSDYIPLSVLILGLLIILITAVLCSAGIIVLVLHRKRQYKKKEENEQIRESSPVHIRYSMYGHKTTHHMTERPGSVLCEQRIANPVVQVYQTPPFTPKHVEQSQVDENELSDPKKITSNLIENDSNSLQDTSNIKFNDPSAEFLSFQDASYLYRNLIEKERQMQQLGIAEYLRKNIAHLQPDLETRYPGTHEEVKLMEALMYTRPRKVVVEQTKNEYFELKANLHSEPDYLEVLEQQA